jgi:hypothetical protein
MGDEGKAVGWLLLADGFAYLSTRLRCLARGGVSGTQPLDLSTNQYTEVTTSFLHVDISHEKIENWAKRAAVLPLAQERILTCVI